MSYVMTQLRCQSCNAPLQAVGDAHAGMTIACKYCGAVYVLSEENTCDRQISPTLKREVNNHYHMHNTHHTHYHAPTATHHQRAVDNDCSTSHERWERRKCKEVREKRRREAERRKKLGNIVATVLLGLFVVTLVFTLTQTEEEMAAICVTLVAFEVTCFVAVLNGALELKAKSMELAPDEVRAPISSSRVGEMNHADITTAFLNAGFEDVRPEGLHDLGFVQRHLASREGRVASVRIARKSNFDAGSIFHRSDVVSIRYHSAKESLVTRILSA